MLKKPIQINRFCKGQVNISGTIRKLLSRKASHLGLVGFKVANNRLGHIGEANGGGSK